MESLLFSLSENRNVFSVLSVKKAEIVLKYSLIKKRNIDGFTR